MSVAMRPCPGCGALNRENADRCYLCQEVLREAASPSASRDAARPPSGEEHPRPEGTAGPPGSDGSGARPSPPAGGSALSNGPSALRPSGAAEGTYRPGPMLDIFEAARRNARLSLLLFLLLFGVFSALGAVIGRVYGSFAHGIALALVLYAILASVAWFNGSSIVLSAHGAREADPERDRRLLNVVEEMGIASGIPAPRACVMESPGLNAFAAGRRPEEAVIAVTSGLMERLDREELQGVIAHEMAHIKSRDTLYNVCAAVLVGAIALLADMFLRSSPFRGRGRPAVRGAGRANAAFMLLGVVLAVLAPLAARLLRMSISRQREYHADAAGAAFTRNPLGLARALEKIAAEGAHVPGENRGTQHLFLVNPLREGSSASALLSTHPPTEARIQRLKRMAGF